MFILFAMYGEYDDGCQVPLVVSNDRSKLEIIIEDINKCLPNYFKEYDLEFPKNDLLNELYDKLENEPEEHQEEFYILGEEKYHWIQNKKFEFVPEHLQEYLTGFETDDLQFYIKEIKEI